MKKVKILSFPQEFSTILPNLSVAPGSREYALLLTKLFCVHLHLEVLLTVLPGQPCWLFIPIVKQNKLWQ